MAIKTVLLGGTDWSEGDILYAADVNATFDASHKQEIVEIYTGSTFDTSVSGANQSQANSYEMTAVASASIEGANYVRVKIFGTGLAKGNNGESSTVSLKVQVKETGGSYADSIAYKSFNQATENASGVSGGSITCVFEWIHTLTAGEKASGFQIKVFSQSVTGNNVACSASFVNIQTSAELLL